MKKVVLPFILTGLLIGSPSLEAAVSKWRAVKCSISRFHKKFNCTEEEKAVGKKWLIGASITAALVALAAVVAGGVKLAEVRAEKQRFKQIVPQPTQQIVALPTQPIKQPIKQPSKRRIMINKLQDQLNRGESPSPTDMMEGIITAYQSFPRTLYPQLLNTIKEKNIDSSDLILGLQGAITMGVPEEMANPIIEDLKKLQTPEQKRRMEQRAPLEQAALKQGTHVQISDAKIKKELKLNSNKDFFKWYEVIGYKSPPAAKNEAIKVFRRLSGKYHPDKVFGNPEKKEFYNKVVSTITEAKALMTVMTE